VRAAVQRDVQRAHLLPQSFGLGLKASGLMSYLERHSAPMSAKPSSRAPAFASSTKRV
jgi:hypothetical protein